MPMSDADFDARYEEDIKRMEYDEKHRRYYGRCNQCIPKRTTLSSVAMDTIEAYDDGV